MKRIVYSLGYPYGALMIWVRGGATREAEVKQILKDNGFHWDGLRHGWQTVQSDTVTAMLRGLKARGYEVAQKEGSDYPPLPLDDYTIAAETDRGSVVIAEVRHTDITKGNQ